MYQLSQGQIVDVAITDPRGQNKKPRPVVILTATRELSLADEFVVVAVSSSFDEPLPSDSIRLPWSPDGRAKSGLTKPSVAKCRWLKKVTREDVISLRGCLPATVMRDIIRAVQELQA